MLAYVLRRLLQAVPVVLLSSVVIFLLLHLVPGDPAQAIAGPDATPEVLAAIRHDLALDRPLPVQYLRWIAHVGRGDFGRSYANKRPVRDLIAQRLPATLQLAAAALLLTVLIALPTGILAAVRQRGIAAWLVSSANALAIAIPNFWFGILAILLFSLKFGWLPPGGRADFGDDPLLALKFLALPALTLALHPAASLSRIVKASMMDVLSQDYVRTARAKGLSSRAVLLRHALRNALAPVMTILGLLVGRLIGGAVIVESVFAWPGMGRLIVQAINSRDYVVVQGALLLLVLLFIIVNLVTDLACAALDPRIRLTGRRGY